MPTLIRLLVVIAVLVAFVWGTMLAMVTFFAPHPREMTRDVTLPSRK